MKRIMTYILLRDNKETGPLSLEDIRNKGLRSTDLVWVEGQSVCWLNPGQVAELRDFAGETVVPIATTKSLDETNKVEKEEPLPYQEQDEKKVTGNTISAYMPVPEEQVFSKPVQPTSKTSKSVVSSEVTTETKFSQPLDELKELYAKTLEKRLREKSFSVQLPPQVKKGAVYVGLLAAGIIAGVLINKDGKKEKNDPGPGIANVDANQKADPEQSLPAIADSMEVSAPLVSTLPANERYYSPESRSEEPPVQPVERKERKTGPQVIKEVPPPVNQEKEIAESRPKETTERTVLNEIRSLVSVKSNKYDVGSFGGIRNLQLTVNNDSKYTLDQVVVELQYLKPRDEFLKTEHISFQAIGPNDSKTVAIPKSTRGVKVTCRILRIESKEMSNTTAGL